MYSIYYEILMNYVYVIDVLHQKCMLCITDYTENYLKRLITNKNYAWPHADAKYPWQHYIKHISIDIGELELSDL